MARTARGADHLARAIEALAQAQTAEELRQAQAVALPLAHGLSLQETARAIGRSVAWTCRARTLFLAGQSVSTGRQTARGGRRNHHMSEEQERQALAPHLERERTGEGALVVAQLKAELEAMLGKPIALSTVYSMLHRHGWRHPTRGKCPPPSDEKA